MARSGLFLGGLGFLLAAAAASASDGTLHNRVQTVLWSGTLNRATPPTGEIPECAEVACDRFDLRVDLGRHIWDERSGGVQVAIRWEPSGNDNLRLYVYRDGLRLAASDGIISTAQSVLLPVAENGQYRVYVAFDTDSTNDTVAYDGLSEVEFPPRVEPLRQLLPDLKPIEQRNIRFDPEPGIFFDVISTEFPSCFQSEVDEQNAHKCLRFDQIFANVGEGVLQLRFAIPHDPSDPSHSVFQRISWSDSPDHFEDRLAGEWEFHPIHQHYHYKGFGLSRLWKMDAQGHREGDAPIRTGEKIGFCLADVEIHDWAKKGDGPRTYNAPDCLFPVESDDQFDYLRQGITPGWSDVYEWYLPDQFVEVSGIPDGDYILETIADPDGQILERRENRNNCVSVRIRLSDMTADIPSAQILGPGPRCHGPQAPPETE